VNVRRWGMGSPERSTNRKDTQVENLCYESHGYGSTSVAVP